MTITAEDLLNPYVKTIYMFNRYNVDNVDELKRCEDEMIKYEFDIVDIRRCIEIACDEIFNDSKLSDMSYKIIDDAVEDFLYDHKIKDE